MEVNPEGLGTPKAMLRASLRCPQHGRALPLWRGLARGCHLNRPIARLINDSGLRLMDLETGHLISGPRLATFHYRGQAVA
jgi:hypothetical protein